VASPTHHQQAKRTHLQALQPIKQGVQDRLYRLSTAIVCVSARVGGRGGRGGQSRGVARQPAAPAPLQQHTARGVQTGPARLFGCLAPVSPLVSGIDLTRRCRTSWSFPGSCGLVGPWIASFARSRGLASPPAQAQVVCFDRYTCFDAVGRLLLRLEDFGSSWPAVCALWGPRAR
jgi:hypothetical protein